MSNEAHLAENAITAYKRNDNDYDKGFEDFDCELNKKQAEMIFCNLNMESLYEIIIEAYTYRY